MFDSINISIQVPCNGMSRYLLSFLKNIKSVFASTEIQI